MKIYKIATENIESTPAESIPAWLTFNGQYYQSPNGHDILVHDKPELFNLPSYLSEQKYNNYNDYKGLAINKGNVAFRIIPSHYNKPSEMAIYGTRESIRNLFDKLENIARKNNVKSFIVNINGSYESYYIPLEEFIRKYSNNTNTKIYKI